MSAGQSRRLRTWIAQGRRRSELRRVNPGQGILAISLKKKRTPSQSSVIDCVTCRISDVDEKRSARVTGDCLGSPVGSFVVCSVCHRSGVAPGWLGRWRSCGDLVEYLAGVSDPRRRKFGNCSPHDGQRSTSGHVGRPVCRRPPTGERASIGAARCRHTVNGRYKAWRPRCWSARLVLADGWRPPGPEPEVPPEAFSCGNSDVVGSVATGAAREATVRSTADRRTKGLIESVTSLICESGGSI